MIALNCMRTAGVLICLSLLAACSNGRGSLEPEEAQEPDTFTVGGAVSGLAGSGLVLQNNGGSNLTVSADGPITFAAPLANGASYQVTVLSQPANPAQTCTVANAAGTIASGNVTTIAVTCATGVFTIGGTVQGLAGSGLVLRKDDEEDLPIASNGNFTFATEEASGTPYQIIVKTPPANPNQTCTIANASGTVGGANVRNVNVTCATTSFSIGGTVSGLSGAGLVLKNNGGDDVGVDSSGGFTFPTALASGASYNVTVAKQPANPTQACTITNGTGTVADASVTNVLVSCSTREFTIGGTVSGLAGSGFALLNNGRDNLPVNADGSFTFPTALLSGASYQISIATQPTNPTQNCTFSQPPSGVVGGSNVTSIAVRCVTTEFTVGGSVSGLVGTGLVLQNNGSDDFAVAANGPFTFPDSLPSGASYNVTVASHSSNPTQDCVVVNPTGTVGNANVSNVRVTCTTREFTIGGTVSGLAGFGLELRNNGTDEQDILPINTSFTFETELLSGAPYNVTVEQEPFFPSQTCTVTNGTGTVGGANVTDVLVTCQ